MGKTRDPFKKTRDTKGTFHAKKGTIKDRNIKNVSKVELKRRLMKVREEREKVGLKLNIQKTKIMGSSPITPWQIDGEKMETVTDFIFFGSKIIADDDSSHDIKRHLFVLEGKQ